MKKKYIFLAIILIFVLMVALGSWAIYISFTKVKPTTEAINDSLKRLIFSKIIRIPEGIHRPSYDFYETRYFWEMETNDKEVTGIQFNYTPAFSKNESEIIATLEIPENGDPSIFQKVLPAVISDRQSLVSAQDPLKANLNSNTDALYDSINLELDKKNNQTTKIVWRYQKDKLPQEIKDLYKKIDYSESILKKLHTIPGFLMGLVRG